MFYQAQASSRDDLNNNQVDRHNVGNVACQNNNFVNSNNNSNYDLN